MPYRPQIKGDLQWDEVKPVDDPRYGKFPEAEDLDGRMNAITSSLNNGMKALMWSAGLSRSWRTPKQIEYYVRQAVGDGYVVTDSTFLSYAEETMGPIGAVAKANVKRGEREAKAFALTDEGEHFRPVVDYTIKYFVDKDLDFYEVFASAQGGAPKTRIDILRILSEKREQRIEDFAESLGLSKSHLGVHAKVLKDVGLIDFESVSTHEGNSGFPYVLEKSLSKLPKVHTYGIDKVRRAFENLGCTHENRIQFTYIEFAKAGGYSEHTAKAILSGLHTAGFTKLSSFRKHEARSSLKPNEKTKEFYKGWIVPVSEALETGDVSALETNLDRNYYFAVADRFAETSPFVNKQSKEVRLKELIALIELNHGITARELAKKTNLRQPGISKILKLAKKKGLVTSVPSETSESVSYFYPVQQD